jgi:hypothetical protein
MTRAAVAVADAAHEPFVLEFQVADGSWHREPLSSCLGTRFEEALQETLEPIGIDITAEGSTRAKGRRQ